MELLLPGDVTTYIFSLSTYSLKKLDFKAQGSTEL